MAVVIPKKWLDGGRGLNQSHKIKATTITIKEVADSLADDATNMFLIAQLIADKLDVEANVTATDYRSGIDAIAAGPLTTKEA